MNKFLLFNSLSSLIGTFYIHGIDGKFMSIMAFLGWIAALCYRVSYFELKKEIEYSKLTPSQKIDKELEEFDRYYR